MSASQSLRADCTKALRTVCRSNAERLNGLRGEVLDQINLLVGERSYFRAIDDDGANKLVVLEHRHRDYRPCIRRCGNLRLGIAGRRIEIPGLGQHVDNMNGPLREPHAAYC